jgi:hypothetical protein
MVHIPLAVVARFGLGLACAGVAFAHRSPGVPGFIPRHIEQPASLHSKPASVKIVSTLDGAGPRDGHCSLDVLCKRLSRIAQINDLQARLLRSPAGIAARKIPPALILAARSPPTPHQHRKLRSQAPILTSFTARKDKPKALPSLLSSRQLSLHWTSEVGVNDSCELWKRLATQQVTGLQTW